MKRLSILLIAVLTAGCLLTGCGSGDADADAGKNQNAGNEGANAEVEENYTGFSFVYNGTEIMLNAEMTPIVDVLGEADSYFESESCAFQGLDKVYTYGSVVICTYPENEVDYVYTIELKDDTVETEEGIYIGASKEDVISIYGTPPQETEDAYVYEKGESKLSFIFEEDVVQNIIYTAITE